MVRWKGPDVRLGRPASFRPTASLRWGVGNSVFAMDMPAIQIKQTVINNHFLPHCSTIAMYSLVKDPDRPSTTTHLRAVADPLPKYAPELQRVGATVMPLVGSIAKTVSQTIAMFYGFGEVPY
jgi:hypothetical protein